MKKANSRLLVLTFLSFFLMLFFQSAVHQHYFRYKILADASEKRLKAHLSDGSNELLAVYYVDIRCGHCFPVILDMELLLENLKPAVMLLLITEEVLWLDQADEIMKLLGIKSPIFINGQDLVIESSIKLRYGQLLLVNGSGEVLYSSDHYQRNNLLGAILKFQK